MATSDTSGAPTADMMISVFDGTRHPIRDGLQILYRVVDGNQKQVLSKYESKSFVYIPNLHFFDNFGDDYSIIVSAPNFFQAGFFPVKISPKLLATADLMLIPKNSELDFSEASWSNLEVSRPKVFSLLSAGVASNFAQARYEELRNTRPASLASFFNLTTAMEQISLPVGTPLDYMKQLKWDDSYQQDRFFCYADKNLLNQVKLAAQEGTFVPEIGPGFFHPGATSSYKQVQFGEANVQLTFHEGDVTTIGGVECVCLEPDIDYYKDLAAHALLEVLQNKLTGGLTDPKTVYVLRWIAGRHAGVAPFEPPYRIVASS